MNQATNKGDEMIVVVQRYDVFEGESLTFQGIERGEEKVTRIMSNVDNSGTIMRRGSTTEPYSKDKENAELNIGFKQLVSFVLLTNGSEYFVTERISHDDEHCSHGILSIGTRSHIECARYWDLDSMLLRSAIRKLNEKLIITNSQPTVIHWVGLINDDTDVVDRVHLGILGIIQPDPVVSITVKAPEQINGFWAPLEHLLQADVYDRLDSWSKTVVKMLAAQQNMLVFDSYEDEK